MALSSVSVVTNLAAAAGFKPHKRNWLSELAPFVMAIFYGVLCTGARIVTFFRLRLDDTSTIESIMVSTKVS